MLLHQLPEFLRRNFFLRVLAFDRLYLRGNVNGETTGYVRGNG